MMKKEIKYVDPSELRIPSSARRSFDADDIQELADSYDRHGCFTPIEVMEDEHRGLVPVTGFRRVTAAKKAGLEEIPAIQVELDEDMIKERRIVSNHFQKDMNVMDKIEIVGELFNRLKSFDSDLYKPDRGPDNIQGALSKRLGVSEKTISEWLQVYKYGTKSQKRKIRTGNASLAEIVHEIRQSRKPDNYGSRNDRGKTRTRKTPYQKFMAWTERKPSLDKNELSPKKREKVVEALQKLLDYYSDFKEAE